MRWTAIGNGLFCPSAVCPTPGRITLFARGAAGELLHRHWEDSGWGRVRSLGIPIARGTGLPGPVPADWPFTVCSANPRRIDLFVRSPDGDLLQMTGSGEEWGPWQWLGSPATMSGNVAIPLGLAGPPAACSQAPDRIDIFVAGQSGELLHTFCNGTDWSDFEFLGAPTMQIGGTRQPVPLFGPLAACSCGNGCMGVFVRGPLGDLMLKWWDKTRWSEFESLAWPQVPDEIYPAVTHAAPLTGPPAACSWGRARMDVIARGPGGAVFHKWWDGKAWSPFECLGMPTTGGAEPRRIPFTGALATCTWGENRLDIFARAVDGNLYHAWWNGSWDHD